MEKASSLALRPSLPLRIDHRPFRSSMAARASPLSVAFARIFPTQFRALGVTTTAPSSSTEKFSLKITEPEDMTVCAENREDDRGTEDGNSSPRDTDDPEMVKICNKLIEVFLVDKPAAADWRKLLAYSRQWSHIRPHFYKRCQERADNESDPGMKHKLLRLGRKLKEIDDDLQRHNELLEMIKEAPDEINAILTRHRKDFTKEFFEHLYSVAESYHDDTPKQNDLRRLGRVCIAAVQAYDNASHSSDALNASQLKYRDIINSPTVDASFRKIDNLAKKKELDSPLMLMASKAWSTAEESSMRKEEAQDMMFDLYKSAVRNYQRRIPKEVRILKFLLKIKDPREQLRALNDAFTPGDELEGEYVDYLYTTPKKLFALIMTLLDAYYSSRQGTVLMETRDLLKPTSLCLLEELKKVVKDKFL